MPDAQLRLGRGLFLCRHGFQTMPTTERPLGPLDARIAEVDQPWGRKHLGLTALRLSGDSVLSLGGMCVLQNVMLALQRTPRPPPIAMLGDALAGAQMARASLRVDADDGAAWPHIVFRWAGLGTLPCASGLPLSFPALVEGLSDTGLPYARPGVTLGMKLASTAVLQDVSLQLVR
jgi:hypothetical protein